MSPRTIFLLTLSGVILVGLPLPGLMQERTHAPAASTNPAEESARRTVYAELRFSGQPQQLQLRQGKEEWLDIDCSNPHSEWVWQLPLSGMMELEIQGRWSDTAPHAVTLSLEPDGYATRSATEWKEEGSHELHSILRFSW